MIVASDHHPPPMELCGEKGEDDQAKWIASAPGRVIYNMSFFGAVLVHTCSARGPMCIYLVTHIKHVFRVDVLGEASHANKRRATFPEHFRRSCCSC